MRATWTFPALLCMAILAIGGCSQPTARASKPVAVTVEDGSRFPAALAGRWKADRHGWEFVLGPDGQIASAIISLGRVQVLPGQATTRSTKDGDQAIFTPGPWAVDYDPVNSTLTIKIAMESVHVPMGAHTLEGSSTDVFTGVVSPTMDTWQAQWTTLAAYKAITPDGKSTDLSTDQTYGETQPLVFTKTME